MNPQDLVSLMQNPIGFCINKGFNLPPNVQFNGPQDIVMYLMNSGQVSQEQYNQAYQAAIQRGYKV